MFTRYKDPNLRKEVVITIKNEETRSQLEPVRNSYVAIMHQPVTVSSSMYSSSQMHVQIKHSLAYLQDLIPTLAVKKYRSDNISQSRVYIL